MNTINNDTDIDKAIKMNENTFQMDSAITDLVAGYDNLTSALPSLAEKVTTMTIGTEDMAKRLEDKMRNLIDNYEFLEGVASSVPNSVQKLAQNHRDMLSKVGLVFSKEDHIDISNANSHIENIKLEYDRLSSTRQQLNLKSKDIIRKNKNIKLLGNTITTPLASSSSTHVNTTKATYDRSNMSSLKSNKSKNIHTFQLLDQPIPVMWNMMKTIFTIRR